MEVMGLENHLDPYFRGRVAGPGADHPAHVDDYEIDGARLQATAMLYLDEVEGGRTVFVNADPPLKVEPRPGRLLSWLNLTADGRPDPITSHAIETIESGTRVTLTWFVYAPPAAIHEAHEAARETGALMAQLRPGLLSTGEGDARRLFCIDDGVPNETVRSLYEACRDRGGRFVRVRPREIDPRRGPLPPGDMLYTPSTSLVADRVEQQLWQPGVATFHRRGPAAARAAWAAWARCAPTPCPPCAPWWTCCAPRAPRRC